MTLGNAIREVWEMLGEPSDLNPTVNGSVSLTTAAAVRIAAALNDAQDAIATWILPSGRRLKFRCLEKSISFEPKIVTGTLGVMSSDWKILELPPSLATSTSGRFEGWFASVNGVHRRILRHTVVGGLAQIILDKAFTEDPTGLELTLRQRVLRFGSGVDDVQNASRPCEVLYVIDSETGQPVDREYAKNFLPALTAAVGVPGSFSKYGNGIVLDCAPETSRSYELYYVGYPVQASSLDEEFMLPEAFHQAIVLRATWWGFRRYSESTTAYATKRDFMELMQSLQTQIDYEDNLESDRLEPSRR